MRVLHVHSGNIYGGVETALVNLARTRDLLPEMQPTYALAYPGRLTEELLSHGVEVTLLGEARVRKPWTIRRARQRLRHHMEQSQPHVVLCHAPWALAVFGSAVRASGIPLAFFLHGTTEGKHWLERWARRNRPDAALCNGEFTVPSLDAMAPHTPKHIAHYPVPAPPPLSAEDRTEIRKQLQTPTDSPVLIQVSRLDPWKGHELHIKALSEIRDIPDWHCWFVGGPQTPREIQYEERLRQLVSQLGLQERIRFLGQRADVPRLMAAADIYCQPNTGPEPFGITYIEALYAGLPVVTSASGGPLEIIDSTCGIMVQPGDSTAVAGALRRLLENPDTRRRLGERAPARAERVCGPATGLAEWYQALKSVSREGA